MIPFRPCNERTHLWALWYLVWLKHLHHPARYAICWRHMASLEALELEELGA